MRLSVGLERAIIVMCGLIAAPLAAAAYLMAVILGLLCLFVLNNRAAGLFAGAFNVEPADIAIALGLLVSTVWLALKLYRRVGLWLEGSR